MTCFKDLTIYSYIRKTNPWPMENNVGWLGAGRTFRTGEPAEAVLELLWKFCKTAVNPTRGLHQCDICPAEFSNYCSRNGERLLLGSAEIRAFSNRGAIFAAPNLIYHYAAVHHYNPPEEFIDALSEGPCPPDPEYFARIEKLGHDWRILHCDREVPG